MKLELSSAAMNAFIEQHQNNLKTMITEAEKLVLTLKQSPLVDENTGCSHKNGTQYEKKYQQNASSILDSKYFLAYLAIKNDIINMRLNNRLSASNDNEQYSSNTSYEAIHIFLAGFQYNIRENTNTFMPYLMVLELNKFLGQEVNGLEFQVLQNIDLAENIQPASATTLSDAASALFSTAAAPAAQNNTRRPSCIIC